MARYQKTVWMVNCVKLGREALALDRPPFGGELGQRIFENLALQRYNPVSPNVIEQRVLQGINSRQQEFKSWK